MTHKIEDRLKESKIALKAKQPSLAYYQEAYEYLKKEDRSLILKSMLNDKKEMSRRSLEELEFLISLGPSDADITHSQRPIISPHDHSRWYEQARYWRNELLKKQKYALKEIHACS